MVDPHPATSPKPRRLWKVVLVLSLALNLAVAGLVTGAVLSGKVGDRPPRSFDFGIGPVAQSLSPRERREVGRVLRQAGVLRDVNPRGRIAEMITVLEAEPFDADAMREIFAQQGADLARVQVTVQGAMLEMFSGMSPARRAEVAAALAAELEQRPERSRPSGG